jgi:molecular chaperone HscB
MLVCVKCHRPAQPGESVCVCADCGAIQPARAGQSYFEYLGVARVYDLDLRDLELKFKALSRKLHPDRFVSAEPAERLASLRRATDLNQAYRVLRDPVRRAEYILSLEGIDLSREDSGGVTVDPAFLMEILSLREGLLEAKLEGDLEKLGILTADVRGRAADAMSQVAAAFADFRGGAGRPALERAGQALVSLRYFRRFLDEVEAGEEGEARPALPDEGREGDPSIEAYADVREAKETERGVETESHVDVDMREPGDKVPDGFR